MIHTPHYYNVDVTWTQKRRGIVSSPVLSTTIEVSTPPEFTGGEPAIWSPEHFLVAAANSCLMTTFLAIAEASKLEFTTFTSNASGKLEQVDGAFIISEIKLSPILEIQDASQYEKAMRILQKAEAACLISRSLKSTIVFFPTVNITL